MIQDLVKCMHRIFLSSLTYVRNYAAAECD
jgi:hypothetical protein